MTDQYPCADCRGRTDPLCCWNHDYQRPSTNNSAIAQLMQRISAEHEAAQRGLTGIADGAAKHSFITAHMIRLCALKDELGREVGDEAAMMAVCRVVLDESAEVTQ